MAESTPKSYNTDPVLYLYTSLTSGSSHIVTATSRLETILRANRIPFKALDIATDEKARMLWGRRAGKDESGRPRKIPGLVQMGLVVGDLVEIEDWNEYGELKQHVKIVKEGATIIPHPAKVTTSKVIDQKENIKSTSSLAASSSSSSKPGEKEQPKTPTGGQDTSISLALRQVGQEAAQKAKDVKNTVVKPLVGTGTAEPEVKKKNEKEDEEDESEAEDDELSHSATLVPPPISISTPASPKHKPDIALMQSPTSTAWKRAPDGTSIASVLAPPEKLGAHGGQLSPSSSLNTHRGSELSHVSAEEIKQIEDEEKIEEEDESAVEDDKEEGKEKKTEA